MMSSLSRRLSSKYSHPSFQGSSFVSGVSSFVSFPPKLTSFAVEVFYSGNLFHTSRTPLHSFFWLLTPATNSSAATSFLSAETNSLRVSFSPCLPLETNTPPPARCPSPHLPALFCLSLTSLPVGTDQAPSPSRCSPEEFVSTSPKLTFLTNVNPSHAKQTLHCMVSVCP